MTPDYFPHVVVTLLDRDAPFVLYADALLGRRSTCDLWLPDPRVSEIHAFLRHRDTRIEIVRVGSYLAVNGQTVEIGRGVALMVGDTLTLTPSGAASAITLRVLALHDAPLYGLRSARDDLPIVPLFRPFHFLHSGPHGALQPTYAFSATAEALLRVGPAHWQHRLNDERAVLVTPTEAEGEEELSVFSALEVDGETYQLVPVSVTSTDFLSVEVYLLEEQTEIYANDTFACAFTGLRHQLLQALYAHGPASAEQLIEQLYPGDKASKTDLRRRFDNLVATLRRELLASGIHATDILSSRARLYHLKPLPSWAWHTTPRGLG